MVKAFNTGKDDNEKWQMKSGIKNRIFISDREAQFRP